MDYIIEKLNPEDYYKCNNIWDMAKQPNTEKWLEEIKNGSRVVFVYIMDGEFIGEGAVVFENGDPDYTINKQRVYLSRLIVKNEYRNQGIGSTIINYLVNYAKALGYKEFSVGVDLDNIGARKLYDRHGFTRVIFEGEDEYEKYVKLLKTL